MPKNKVDPLGRNHTTVHKPVNRHHVDNVCYYILDSEEEDFWNGDDPPSAMHVYYDAYAVIHGVSTAIEMLNKAKGLWSEK